MFIVILVVDSLAIDMDIQNPGNNSLVTYLKIHKPSLNLCYGQEEKHCSGTQTPSSVSFG